MPEGDFSNCSWPPFDRWFALKGAGCGTMQFLHPGKFELQYLLEQKQQGAKCLFVCRNCDVTFIAQVGEESLSLRCAHFSRAPHAMKTNKPTRPVDIDFFSPRAINVCRECNVSAGLAILMV